MDFLRIPMDLLGLHQGFSRARGWVRWWCLAGQSAFPGRPGAWAGLAWLSWAGVAWLGFGLALLAWLGLFYHDTMIPDNFW